jgi:thiopurine S-methyltransferase
VEPVRTQRGAFEAHETPGIVLLAGDIFALQPADIANVGAVYDRAALVALPPEMRRRYGAHMTALLPPGAQTLLVTFEYAQQEMNGPPFAVPEAEVRGLYGAHHDIHVLAAEDMLDKEPKFRERGLSRLHEKVYLLVRSDVT